MCQDSWSKLNTVRFQYYSSPITKQLTVFEQRLHKSNPT